MRHIVDVTITPEAIVEFARKAAHTDLDLNLIEGIKSFASEETNFQTWDGRPTYAIPVTQEELQDIIDVMLMPEVIEIPHYASPAEADEYLYWKEVG